MLKNFSFSNFKSYLEHQFFDLERTRLNCNERSYVKPLDGGKTELLKTAAIYGANASGKSNFIEALAFVQSIIRSSAENKAESTFSLLSQFKGTSEKTNSDFDIEFFQGTALYNYGFEINDNRVVSEWLYEFPNGKGKGKTILERSWDEVKKKYDYYTPSLELDKKVKDFFFSSLSQYELVIGKAASSKIEQFLQPYIWFDEVLLVIEHKDDFHARKSFRQKTFNQHNQDEKFKNEINSLLGSLDLGFNSFEVEKSEIEEHEIDDDMRRYIDSMVKKLREENPELPLDAAKRIVSKLEPTFIAKFKDVEIKFSFDELSDGSRKIVDFSGVIQSVIVNNRVLVVDEFTDNLHPLLTKRILDLFLSYTNSKSQLIFSTHDVPLMDMSFQRDQVWIVEKFDDLSSMLVPISKYKLRKNSSFEAAYLGGLIGGIPKDSQPNQVRRSTDA